MTDLSQFRIASEAVAYSLVVGVVLLVVKIAGDRDPEASQLPPPVRRTVANRLVGNGWMLALWLSVFALAVTVLLRFAELA